MYEGKEKLFDVPLVLEAEVVHGFKRGSKELGIPTANLSMEQVGERGSALETGIYFGWTLLHGKLYESVTSVGWNPFYKNEVKTIEVHILDTLDDFYGETISVMFNGYLRQEANFASLDELISCIQSDIAKTKQHLNTEKASNYKDVSLWHNFKGK